MRYRGPDPSSPEAIAGLKARRKRKEEESFEALSYGLSEKGSALVEPEHWERAIERMMEDPDSNEEIFDRYA